MVQNAKSWDKINPNERISKEEFLILFSGLPINSMEKEKLSTEYWGVYEKFLESGVDAKTSWLATKNLFINKEPQIGERQRNQINTQNLTK